MIPPGEAYAVCGPAATIAFARVFGRHLTRQEAGELAAVRGFSVGLNALGDEARLLQKMGVAARLEPSVDWEKIRDHAARRQPVALLLGTPGQMLVVDEFNGRTGEYSVFHPDAEWMTAAEIEDFAGKPRGALFAEHPLASAMTGEPVPSVPVVVESATIMVPMEDISPPRSQKVDEL